MRALAPCEDRQLSGGLTGYSRRSFRRGRVLAHPTPRSRLSPIASASSTSTDDAWPSALTRRHGERVGRRARQRAAPGCPAAGLCGFTEGTRALIVDTSGVGAGHDFFTVTGIAGALAHDAPNPPFHRPYAAGRSHRRARRAARLLLRSRQSTLDGLRRLSERHAAHRQRRRRAVRVFRRPVAVERVTACRRDEQLRVRRRLASRPAPRRSRRRRAPSARGRADDRRPSLWRGPNASMATCCGSGMVRVTLRLEAGC